VGRALVVGALVVGVLGGCALDRAAGTPPPDAARGPEAGASRDSAVRNDGSIEAGAGLDAEAEPDAGTGCTEGETRVCGMDVGSCVSGIRTCTGGMLGPCEGSVIRAAESCDGNDEDCDGLDDRDDVDACGALGAPSPASCLPSGEGPRCMYLACEAGVHCCDSGPCATGWVCTHITFLPETCPPECEGQCEACHMCVR